MGFPHHPSTGTPPPCSYMGAIGPIPTSIMNDNYVITFDEVPFAMGAKKDEVRRAQGCPLAQVPVLLAYGGAAAASAACLRVSGS